MSGKFDSSGRPLWASIWDALTGIPTLIDQLGAIPDPNYDAWLAWDDATNQLVMLERLAEFVEYDNATSGLTATNVQDAIDEVVSSSSWAGRVAATGASIGLPSGWTSGLAGSTYTVTHNLGFSTVNDYVVVATANQGGAHASAQISSYGVNSFDVIVFDDENNGITNTPWGFIMRTI